MKDKETSRLQTKLSNLQNENVQSGDKMLKLEAVTFKLTEELNGFKTESENDWKAISTLQNYNATLNAVNSDLESKIENLTAALEQKETDILSLRSKCENIFHETSKSDHKASADVDEWLDTAKVEMRELETKNWELEAENLRLRQNVRKYNSELRQTRVSKESKILDLEMSLEYVKDNSIDLDGFNEVRDE